MGDTKSLSTLFEKLDQIICLLEKQLEGHNADRTIDEKVHSAYMALAKFGPNYSAISRETGIHRNTLSKSVQPEWVLFRAYFKKLKDDSQVVKDESRIRHGSKDVYGDVEAWE